MAVSSNWKKFMEDNTGKTLVNIVLSALVAYLLYSSFKVHFRQIGKTAPKTEKNNENSCHGRGRGSPVDKTESEASCSERTRGSPEGLGAKNRDQKYNRLQKRNFPKRLNQYRQQEQRLTEVVALDCEMVGIQDGNESMLARVSVVNSHGHTLYDTFVKPTEPVVDYRTPVSGIRPRDLERGVEFHVAQKTVADMIKGRVLVGHALRNDLRVLYLSHPRRKTRDTSKYAPFREVTNGKTPSLKKLAKEILGINLQMGEHSSVEDARAAMQLYNAYKKEWESAQF